MPGPYAHITLVNQLRQAKTFESIGLPSFETQSGIEDFFRFCELGAVSPDYPNLAGGEGGAAQWADAMHYRQTGDMLRSAVKYVRGIEGGSKCKLLAWLLGYCAHVVTDVTIHPVVLAKVGDYSENKRQHRLCEMNQDVQVFKRMNCGEISASDRFTTSIQGCGNPENKFHLDQDIVALWYSMFHAAYPRRFAANPPDINAWHSRFVTLADASAAHGSTLFPLGSLIASGLGYAYPALDKVDGQFVESLHVPFGPVMQYDAIFDKAAAHVRAAWKQLITAVYGDRGDYLSHIGEWNLDTGRDENNRLVFWGDGHQNGSLPRPSSRFS